MADQTKQHSCISRDTLARIRLKSIVPPRCLPRTGIAGSSVSVEFDIDDVDEVEVEVEVDGDDDDDDDDGERPMATMD
jgi:hypothetical protein